jgi:hypothetical protein
MTKMTKKRAQPRPALLASNDRRQNKRFDRLMMEGNGPLYNAYHQGEYDGLCGRPKRNRYPAGRRWAEYERGYASADPV